MIGDTLMTHTRLIGLIALLGLSFAQPLPASPPEGAVVSEIRLTVIVGDGWLRVVKADALQEEPVQLNALSSYQIAFSNVSSFKQTVRLERVSSFAPLLTGLTDEANIKPFLQPLTLLPSETVALESTLLSEDVVGTWRLGSADASTLIYIN